MRDLEVAIIIPIYKVNPDADELISLKQCIKILKKHPIIFIGPPQLDTVHYEEICQDNVKFRFTAFDGDYFSGIEGYNALMLSPGFYKRFFDYRFILIYQLDAYVFNDYLLYWCMQNYDFIGAPHFSMENVTGKAQFLNGYRKLLTFTNGLFGSTREISLVGNGGFSLRKTKSCYLLLKLLKKQVLKWGTNNEDLFFTYWGNIMYPFFRLPTNETALSFAIEQSPLESLKKNGNLLPFGCHAFRKYEPEFWSKFIEI